MEVTVKAIGDLREYFGREPHTVVLSESAVLNDLLLAIEERWGVGLPSYLWDFNSHQFRGPVLLVVDKKAVQDLNAPLKDGLQVSIMRAIAGG